MNETTQAAPSTAVAEPEITEVQLPRSGSEEYANWRMTGELPQPKAESAPADAPKEATPETAAESGPATKQQEPRKGKDAEHRIKELLAEQKRLRAEVEAMRTRPQTQAEPKPQPQQSARTKPTLDAKNQDGTAKYANYEDYVEDLADWKAEQRIAQQMRDLATQAQNRELQSKVETARTRYENFDQVGFPALNSIVSDQQISPVVKGMVNDSEVLPDLLFTLGSNQADFARFLALAKTNPGKAIRYLAAIESGIVEALQKPAKTEPETPATPARRGPENAPPPPIEIGNRGGPVDDTDRLLKAAANGDRNATRQLLEAENRKMLARRRGA